MHFKRKYYDQHFKYNVASYYLTLDHIYFMFSYCFQKIFAFTPQYVPNT